MSHRHILLTAAATSLALAACNQNPAGPVTGAPIASLPLAKAAPPPETPAPYANALPAAPPIQRVSTPRRPVYSYIDDAYELGDALADSPPDYTVDYDGVRPWVWRAADGEYRVVEDTPDGDRTYYYRGDGDYPYLIQDPQYAYAYDNGGELVEVYDSYGRPYPNYAATALVIAAQYLVRGRHLHYAAIHDQRQAAYAGDWRARRDQVFAPQRQWATEQQRNPDWRRVHDARVQQQQPQQAAFQQERAQRQAYATRLAPVIAAAPQAPRPEPRHEGPPPGAPGFAGDRGPPGVGAQNRDPGRDQQRQQQIQADTAARVQAQAQAQVQAKIQAEGAQRQPQQAHDQQRAQAETAQRQQQAQAQAGAQQRTQAEAAQRQQAQSQAQAQARDQQKAQAENAQRAQQQVQAHDQQQRAQAEAAQHQQHQQQQQAQAHDVQKAQADAASHARDEANRQAQVQAQASMQHQQQAAAQTAAAQQHQQQAQTAAAQQRPQEAAAHAAEAQQHAQQAASQQAQAAQHAQAAAQQQHAAQAAKPQVAHPQPQTEKKPDQQKQ